MTRQKPQVKIGALGSLPDRGCCCGDIGDHGCSSGGGRFIDIVGVRLGVGLFDLVLLLLLHVSVALLIELVVMPKDMIVRYRCS